MGNRVLLIEDDPTMFEALQLPFQELEITLEHALDGESGLKAALQNEYELVIIDGNLPKLSGFDVCRKLRNMKGNLSIIMLTSRVEEIDRVLGLELGADDYLTKPFYLRELLARVKGILRRNRNIQNVNTLSNSNSGTENEIIHAGAGIVINTLSCEVTINEKQLELTAMEYRLLLLFASNPGKVFSRQQLLEEVWGLNAGDINSTITVMIGRLRAKIEKEPGYPKIIETVRGLGYRFSAE